MIKMYATLNGMQCKAAKPWSGLWRFSDTNSTKNLKIKSGAELTN